MISQNYYPPGPPSNTMFVGLGFNIKFSSKNMQPIIFLTETTVSAEIVQYEMRLVSFKVGLRAWDDAAQNPPW